VRILAPIEPPFIVGLGFNYPKHAEQASREVPKDEPLLHFKPSTAVVGPNEAILYPKVCSDMLVGGELAVVIGRVAKNVSVQNARDYILGYTIANDVTSRDILRKEGRPTRGKSFDTFCPIGPCIETELNTDDIVITTSVNGEVKSKGSTKQMTFNVAQLVSFISHFKTMLPGEIINTGSPTIEQIVIGDTVDIEIEGIGVLTNPVARGT